MEPKTWLTNREKIKQGYTSMGTIIYTAAYNYTGEHTSMWSGRRSLWYTGVKTHLVSVKVNNIAL